MQLSPLMLEVLPLRSYEAIFSSVLMGRTKHCGEANTSEHFRFVEK